MDTDGYTQATYRRRAQITDRVSRGLVVNIGDLKLDDSGIYWVAIDKIYADIMTRIQVTVTKGKTLFSSCEVWLRQYERSFGQCTYNCSHFTLENCTYKVRNIHFILEAVIKPKVWSLSSLKMTCWGQPSVFRCRSERGMDVQYSWYRVGHPNNIVLHHSTDLFLHCSNITEDSQFYCSAFNDVSSQNSEFVSLQLLQPADKDCVYLISSYGEFNLYIKYFILHSGIIGSDWSVAPSSVQLTCIQTKNNNYNVWWTERDF